MNWNGFFNFIKTVSGWCLFITIVVLICAGKPGDLGTMRLAYIGVWCFGIWVVSGCGKEFTE